MARDVESLVLQMSADLRRFEKSMASMSATAQKRLTQVEAQALRSQKNLEKIMARAGDGMVNGLKGSLTSLAPTLAAAFSAQQVIKYADSYTSLQNRLKAAGLEGRELQRVENALYETANRNGLQVQATAELYSRASLSRQRLGASEQQLLQLVSGTAAALKVQGTSAEAASGPLLQLGQALSGTKVQAEEYNSLIDGLPVLLQAAAKGSDRFGGDVAKLTEQVKSGKVTSQEFFQALLKGFPAIEAQAGASTTTVSSALQTLDNQLGRYIGQSDSSLSATQRAAQGIVGLAENLDTVIPAVTALATVVGGRYVLSLTAAASAQVAAGVSAARLAVFQTAMTASMTGTSQAALLAAGSTRTFSAAIAANPIGAALVAVTALAAGIAFLSEKYGEASTLQREQKTVTDRASTAIDAYRDAAAKAAVATGDNAKAAHANAEAMRLEALQAVRSAQALQQRRQALLQQRVVEAQKEAADIRTSAGPGQTTLNQGQYAAAQSEVGIAQRALDQAKAEATAKLGELSQLEQDVKNGRLAPIAPPVVSPTAKSSGSTGPSPQDLAAQREMLALQGQVDLLRAQGRDADADAAQRQIDILNLTKTFSDAGVTNAKKAATDQVNALANAQAAARGREAVAERTKVFLDAAAEAQHNIDQLAQDELTLRIEIARLLGDEAGVQAAQRELDIVQRTADLRSKGVAAPEAKTQATSETDRLRGAEIVGGLGDAFKNPLDQMREQYAEIDRLRQIDVLSEQEAAAAKAQANAVYQEQRLSNAQSFFGTLAELQNSSNKELAAIGKAAAIAQATMDGYVAVQKALASAPPPFNYALAAAVGVVAAANVAKIAGMADGGPVRGVGGPRQDNQIRALSVGEYVVNAKATARHRALLDTINRGGVVKMADGGIVGVPTLPRLRSREPGSSLSYSPTIDARGADMAAVARLEAVMDQNMRSLPRIIKGVNAHSAKWRLGQNADA